MGMRGLTAEAREEIAEFFDCSSEEICNSDELRNALFDSVQPCFCIRCGLHITDLKPDAEEVECPECGMKTGYGLEVIVVWL